MKSLFFVSLLLGAAAPAAAEQATTASADERPAAEAPAAETANDGERRICRRVEANTGTRLGGQRRVCMTQREWRNHDRMN